ncbi:hypothetical protein [Niabella hibiscisoli]|uniref:hypothetical protein n=1 Tax=Niabella hibiscisoli TaxID=1825928 RepID=UPI001F0EE681|nr:hypothetical protein [Niabella hibiscisoli]MCH5720757.1 hypothetical protein [Niabella hibiscisoli]
MKAIISILFVALCSTIAFARQGEIFVTVNRPDTTRVIKEYGPDSILLSTSRQQMINGCRKELEHRLYDQQGLLKEMRNTRYAAGKENTCDFTPYIICCRLYEKGKLSKEYFRQAACDECESVSCGIEKRWNPQGKLIFNRSYKKCSFKPATLKEP